MVHVKFELENLEIVRLHFPYQMLSVLELFVNMEYRYLYQINMIFVE